ncbi:MAG: RluA family pseudouridine synthase [Moraxella sp.]|uniref:RluA family pseudouridine synthase n=1 Tax=Moraxella sp. TaxID=479 RepID=UPI0026DA83BE|nr:RluA family pseudouridine synthase [Moraxella sp.]MDO4449609.1 RluA family pseudouridine synthase [Moraxella sp.]
MKKPTPKATPKPQKPQSADDTISDFAKVNFISVTANQDGQRIDNFLLARLKGLPRSHLYKMIRDDEIRINKKRCKPHDRVYAGDVVRVAPVRLSKRDEPVVSDDFAKGLLGRVIFENEGLIVLNKPHGMAVHGGSGESFGVIEAMRVATGKKYLELIHRIDKDTSGLLLIAKKRSTLKDLQDKFREKTIFKDYLCLCVGDVGKTLGKTAKIDKPLLKYTLANGERRVRVDKDGKPSQTLIEVLSVFEMGGQVVSLVKASPLTGRTHQIRVHLASVGHALLGDDKYLKVSAPAVARLCLHAHKIRFDEYEFVAELPKDIKISWNQELSWCRF